MKPGRKIQDYNMVLLLLNCENEQYCPVSTHLPSMIIFSLTLINFNGSSTGEDGTSNRISASQGLSFEVPEDDRMLASPS